MQYRQSFPSFLIDLPRHHIRSNEGSRAVSNLMRVPDDVDVVARDQEEVRILWLEKEKLFIAKNGFF